MLCIYCLYNYNNFKYYIIHMILQINKIQVRMNCKLWDFDNLDRNMGMPNIYSLMDLDRILKHIQNIYMGYYYIINIKENIHNTWN